MADPRLFPSGSNASDERAPGCRQYNPCQDLNIPYNYKTLYDLPTSPEFLFQEESVRGAAPLLGREPHLLHGYLSGAVGGAAFGLRDAGAGAEPAKIRANRVLNAILISNALLSLNLSCVLGLIAVRYANLRSD